MKTKTVNRYYCEFCKKSGGHAGAMRKHEKHCTMNPDRECRMCILTLGAQSDLKELIAMLPDMEKFKAVKKGFGPDENGNWSEFEWEEYPGYQEAVEEAFKKIREECENCPACLLAVIRQGGIFVDFKYQEESDKYLQEYNRNHPRGCY